MNVVSTVTQAQQAASQLNVAKLDAQTRAQLDASTADMQQNGEANGINAALSLLSKGSFDPNNQADMESVMVMTEGALCACGLPMIAGALALLDVGAHALAGWLEQEGIIQQGHGWSHTGGAVTTADVLRTWGWPAKQSVFGIPQPPPTRFAQVAVPIFAKLSADAINGGSVLPFSVLLEALTSWWNKAGGSSASVACFAPGYFANGLTGLGVPGYGGVGPGVLPMTSNGFFNEMTWPLELLYAFAPVAALPKGWNTANDPWASYSVKLNAGPKASAFAGVVGVAKPKTFRLGITGLGGLHFGPPAPPPGPVFNPGPLIPIKLTPAPVVPAKVPTAQAVASVAPAAPAPPATVLGMAPKTAALSGAAAAIALAVLKSAGRR